LKSNFGKTVQIEKQSIKTDNLMTPEEFKNFIIVTNDDDFLNLTNMKGFPPKVVLLRTGK